MSVSRLIKRTDPAAASASADAATFQPWSGRRILARETVQLPGGHEEPLPYRRGIIRRQEAEVCAHTVEPPTREVHTAPFDVVDFTEQAVELGQGKPRTGEARHDEPPPAPTYSQDQLDELRAQWERDAAARHAEALEAARAEAYTAGVAAGREAAEQELQAAIDEAVHALNDAASQFAQALQTYIRQTEPVLLELAFGIAEQVLGTPATEALRTVAIDELAAAIDQLAADPPLDVLVHPVELLRLQETGVMEQLEQIHTRLRWQPDPSLRQNEWVVQSPMAAIRRLEDELLTALRQRFAEHAAPPADASQPSSSDAPAAARASA